MMLIVTMTAALVSNGDARRVVRRVLVLMVYPIFALTLHLLPAGVR